MKLIIAFTLIVFSEFTFADDGEKVKGFFDKNKIGNSADYGVYKTFNKYHVITIHGFDKDLDVCLEIVKLLNKEQPDTYSCKPLNH